MCWTWFVEYLKLIFNSGIAHVIWKIVSYDSCGTSSSYVLLGMCKKWNSKYRHVKQRSFNSLFHEDWFACESGYSIYSSHRGKENLNIQYPTRSILRNNNRTVNRISSPERRFEEVNEGQWPWEISHYWNTIIIEVIYTIAIMNFIMGFVL